MIGLTLPAGQLNILVIGAHPDDIEIGCGGTLLKLQQTRHINFRWVVLTGTPEREQEAQTGAQLFGCSGIFGHFTDGYLNFDPKVKSFLAQDVRFAFEPDIIFCPWRGDAHQDHRAVGEIVHQIWRNHLILEYEIPKYDGDLGRPNVFVPLDPSIIAEKGTHLMKAFPSQQDKPWFDLEVFDGLARLRGVECRSDYAEAFYSNKLCLAL